MTIRDEHALKFAWEELKFWENENDSKAKEIINREKKAIRKYNKYHKQIKKCIYNDDDTTVFMIWLPDKVKSFTEADAYFCNHYYRPYIETAYDCTGQIYTKQYKIIKRNGKYIAYHFLGMNI